MADPRQDDPTQVNLGGRIYKLEPQRVGRIAKRLRTISEVFGGDTPPDEVTGVVHDALKVFLPDLAGEWELAGYPSAEAYAEVLRHRQAQQDAVDKAQRVTQSLLDEHGVDKIADLPEGVEAAEYDEPEPDWADPYVEASDRSPTVPEIADAVEAIYAVNGGKRLERLLGKVIDPAVFKVLSRQMIVRWATTAMMSQPPPQASASTDSPSSPQANGASPSPTSGTSEATPGPSPADAPSPSEPPDTTPAAT